jgi:hypothetical protein
VSDNENAKTYFRSAVVRLRQLLLQDGSCEVDKTAVKEQFINKYVAALGYADQDIVREYYVRDSHAFLDYVIQSGESPLLAMQVNPLQEDLTDRQAARLLVSCILESIKWGALTNGRELWLIDAASKGGLQERFVQKLDLLAFNTQSQFDALFERFCLLSKNSILASGRASEALESERSKHVIREILTDPSSNSVRAICAELASRFGLTATPQMIVHRLAAQIGSGGSSPVKAQPAAAPAAAPQPAKKDAQPKLWILAVAGGPDHQGAVQRLHLWLDRDLWVLQDNMPARAEIRAGDRICFYAERSGIVVTGVAAGKAIEQVSQFDWPDSRPSDGRYYKLPLRDIHWLPAPAALPEKIRRQLELQRKQAS